MGVVSHRIVPQAMRTTIQKNDFEQCACSEKTELSFSRLRVLSSSPGLRGLRRYAALSHTRRHFRVAFEQMCDSRVTGVRARPLRTRQGRQKGAQVPGRLTSVRQCTADCSVRTTTKIDCSKFTVAEDAMVQRATELIASGTGRTVVGLAGLPGSGKSTAAANVIQRCERTVLG